MRRRRLIANTVNLDEPRAAKPLVHAADALRMA
jgi:hypothetical protein